jgi:hypothetical protein
MGNSGIVRMIGVALILSQAGLTNITFLCRHSDMQAFAALTGAYMNASSLRIVNTIDDSGDFGASFRRVV